MRAHLEIPVPAEINSASYHAYGTQEKFRGQLCLPQARRTLSSYPGDKRDAPIILMEIKKYTENTNLILHDDIRQLNPFSDDNLEQGIIYLMALPWQTY